MAWNNRENNSQNLNDQTPVIDRCINCGNQEQVHAQITTEYEGSLNSGPICRKCYSTNRGPKDCSILIKKQGPGTIIPQF